jgi:LytS/YehU family sensor histidine kinase
LVPEAFVAPYFWMYGFVAFLASVSVEIGREFAGAVHKLEDLTATLDARVQQVSQQLEAKLLTQARLETLRYQLNPHFLYNALNSVEALSRDGPAQIPEVVRRLCECPRYALHPKKGGLATLEQELQQVASYLRLEEVRFGENLAVETDVSDAARAALVPEFLLQPLVENAIKYGMRTSEMPLRVVIRAGRANDVLEIEVRNTGHWSSDAGDANSGGVGLENLRSRLDLLYANCHRLKTTDEAGWVSVKVAIPLKSEGAEEVASAATD